MPFPRFKTYEEFVAERSQAQALEPQKLQELIKQNLMDGKNALQRLIDTEEQQRSTVLLPKEKLEKLQRLVVMNSLSLTKAAMLSDAVAKINLANSTQWLPAIDVDKKVVAAAK